MPNPNPAAAPFTYRDATGTHHRSSRSTHR